MEENDVKLEEAKNKKILKTMLITVFVSLAIFLTILYFSLAYLEKGIVKGTVISLDVVFFIIVAFYCLKLEVDAGYYECSKCHHKFVPTYFQAVMAPHIFITRYLKCPNCGKKSWAKKVMHK